jgi:MFS family permease
LKEPYLFMQAPSYLPEEKRATPPYGWIIVAACGLMIFITYGLVYSYSVFFKPLAEYFQWDRATVSLIYSLSVIIRGAAGIGTGWLADKYGPRKILFICGILMGAGYLLSSQVTTLWQFFLTYAVVEAFGMSGTFNICSALVSRWFVSNRGLALGIVGAGSGLGTFLIVPSAERLVNASQWSTAFVIIGIAAGALMIIASLFLRNPSSAFTPAGKVAEKPTGASFGEAIRDSRLWIIMIAFLFFFSGIQIIMVHRVNHATDTGIDPLVAATFISVIGAVSIGSRLLTGVIAERIGIYRTLILTASFLVISFVLLLFTRALWTFYLFAVVFGIPYGGEVTQIPLVIARYFGTRTMATLMGLTIFFTGVGGALGPWVAGKIYDITDSYNGAFMVGGAVAAISIICVLILKRQDSKYIKA